MNKDDFYTLEEAADLIGKAPSWVAQKLYEDQLPTALNEGQLLIPFQIIDDLYDSLLEVSSDTQIPSKLEESRDMEQQWKQKAKDLRREKGKLDKKLSQLRRNLKARELNNELRYTDNLVKEIRELKTLRDKVLQESARHEQLGIRNSFGLTKSTSKPKVVSRKNGNKSSAKSRKKKKRKKEPDLPFKGGYSNRGPIWLRHWQ